MSENEESRGQKLYHEYLSRAIEHPEWVVFDDLRKLVRGIQRLDKENLSALHSLMSYDIGVDVFAMDIRIWEAVMETIQAREKDLDLEELNNG